MLCFKKIARAAAAAGAARTGVHRERMAGATETAPAVLRVTYLVVVLVLGVVLVVPWAFAALASLRA